MTSLSIKKQPGRQLFQILDWDSTFFGYQVAKITASRLAKDELKHLLERLAHEGVRLVCWFVDSGDEVSNAAAQENNGFLADEKVIYLRSIPLDQTDNTSSEKIKSYLLKSASKPLISITLQSGEYSRFKVDPHFRHQEFERLYEKWLENSLNGKLAREVCVYVDNGLEVGILTLGEKNKRADIGLLAVDKKFRRKHIGTCLVRGAFKKSYELGYSEIQVASQKKNVIAKKFYEALGFAEESVSNVYHFWLNGQKTTRIS